MSRGVWPFFFLRPPPSAPAHPPTRPPLWTASTAPPPKSTSWGSPEGGRPSTGGGEHLGEHERQANGTDRPGGVFPR